MEQIRDFETFEPSQIITPDDYPLPKEGTVGYVKVEKRNYERELNPKLFKVDLQCWETVG